jgi:FkbM family methyltransferase
LLHIGAHTGEEKEAYLGWGFKNSFWVEAQPVIFKILETRVGSLFCLQAAVWSKRTNLELQISSNSVSTSLLKFNKETPWKDLFTTETINVETVTLNDVFREMQSRGLSEKKCLIILDVQGAELEILKGLAQVSKEVAVISCEVSLNPTYENGAKRRDIIWKLFKSGFIPLCSFLDANTKHGDQLFIKFSIMMRAPRLLLATLLRSLILFMIKLKRNFERNQIV